MHPRTRRIRLGLSLASELTAMRARNYTCEENRTILAGWLGNRKLFRFHGEISPEKRATGVCQSENRILSISR